MFNARVLARTTPRTALARAPLRRRMYSSEHGKTFSGAEDNEFNRERARIKEHAAESGEFWRKMTVYLAIPAMIVASINGKMRWDAHWEHVEHDPVPLKEKPQYAYQNIRTKNFWWGDGDKTLFWNEKVNYNKKDE
ncbi:cytochrome c oxidase-like protein subunit VIa [Amniculicola lignicola CBS 123094]|uniref:Cytochrome c oxidase subunit n=1 Tax=Amniculicola lignicola CBS 123094 TaxID=1392246 RepID=A0A6A5WNZ6_9PLEO|nr:cytochrome c oxidase-like protein subunit VIa [Amniculicola lignicola CBS 123094]